MREFIEGLRVNLNEKQEERLTEKQAKKEYEKYVHEQEEQFIIFINYLNTYINGLKEKNKDLKNVKLMARIKSVRSALKNYEIKALNDVFGIEIVCDSEEELKMIQDEMNRLLKITRVKKHNKSNGYRAVHHSCIMKKELTDELNILLEQKGAESVEDDLFPLIEVQYKTSNVYGEACMGTSNHQNYKHIEERHLKRIKQLYDNDKITIAEYIPRMWISSSNKDKMERMSMESVLRKMYPSIDIVDEKEEIEK